MCKTLAYSPAEDPVVGCSIPGTGHASDDCHASCHRKTKCIVGFLCTCNGVADEDWDGAVDNVRGHADRSANFNAKGNLQGSSPLLQVDASNRLLTGFAGVSLVTSHTSRSLSLKSIIRGSPWSRFWLHHNT
jgi:hypothetical protein